MIKFLLVVVMFVLLAGVVSTLYVMRKNDVCDWHKITECEWKKVEDFALLKIVDIFARKNENQEGQPVVYGEGLKLPEQAAESALRYPVPGAQIKTEVGDASQPKVREKPLPALNESDQSMRQELNRLFDQQQLDKLFILKTIINRFVVTIDNLTARNVPPKYRLSRKQTGRFIVYKNSANKEFIDTTNYRRYIHYVQFAEAVNTKKLVAIYLRYYPLFQEAYEGLGYPDRYFNDRLIEVIDHLFDMPQVRGPIELKRPSVYYKYADPELEALSAGQKIFIRMGYDNAAKIKAKLRVFKYELIEQVERGKGVLG